MRKPMQMFTAVAMFITVAVGLMPATAQARVVLESRGSRHHRFPADHEFVLEGGLAEPMGDQKDDFWNSDNGFDAATGYQFGARLRQYLSPTVAVAPAFHYTRFGDGEGVGDFGGGAAAYRLKTSNYRYGLDFQAFLGDPSDVMRPYLTGGVALIHNRYRDELQYEGTFETSMNTAAFSAGFGFKLGTLELSGEYTMNRFNTANLTPDVGSQDYNWDYFVFRVGMALGR